jgi:hypothetical protein
LWPLHVDVCDGSKGHGAKAWTGQRRYDVRAAFGAVVAALANGQPFAAIVAGLKAASGSAVLLLKEASPGGLRHCLSAADRVATSYLRRYLPRVIVIERLQAAQQKGAETIGNRRLQPQSEVLG